MDNDSVSGVIMAWTVPHGDREGFTCVLSLEYDDGLPFSLQWMQSVGTETIFT
jgi:hypothetical protein